MTDQKHSILYFFSKVQVYERSEDDEEEGESACIALQAGLLYKDEFGEPSLWLGLNTKQTYGQNMETSFQSQDPTVSTCSNV